MVSWIDVTENRHVGRRSYLRPKDTLAEVTFPPHNAAKYIEYAQLLAMDYPNMLTADAVRNELKHSIQLKLVNSNSLNSNFRIIRVFPTVPTFFLHKVTKFTSDNSKSDNSRFRLTRGDFLVPMP